jgi:endonuclease YncB( thermonuclease family)
MDLVIGYLMDAARWLIILALTLIYPDSFSSWHGKVVEIVRADEFKVERLGRIETVRLYGIDAPIEWDAPKSARKKVEDRLSVVGGELRAKSGRRIPYPQTPGKMAVHYVSERVLGKPVTVQPLPGRIAGPWYWPQIYDHDYYNRVIGIVWIYGEKGESLNEELLREGMSWWYRPFVPFEAGYKHLERKAREAKAGLWAQPHPIPPWLWQATKIEEINPMQKDQ